MKKLQYEQKLEREKSIFLNTINITLFISFLFCFQLAFNFNSVKTNTQVWRTFSALVSFFLSILTLQSLVVCYKRLRNDTVFVISLVYLLMSVRLVYGFYNYFHINSTEFYFSSRIIFFTTALTVMLLLIAILPSNKLKTYLFNNKKKSIAFIFLSVLLIMIFCHKFCRPLSESFYVLSNIVFAFLYFICSCKLFYLSSKENEPFYTFIAISVFMSSLHALHCRFGMYFPDITNTIISLSLNYIGYIIIIAGGFLETYTYITNTKILTEDLSLFFDLCDNNKHTYMVLCDTDGHIAYGNKKLKEELEIYYGRIDIETLNLSNLIGNLNLKERLLNLDEDGFWRGTLESKKGVPIDCSIHLLKVSNKFDYDYYEKVAVTFSDISEIINTEIELEKLKVYNREKVDFISNISHELRTPINIFYSTLQLLDRGAVHSKEYLQTYYDKYSGILHSNCKRMLRLVNNLIDISRVEVGVLKCDSKYYNLVSIVEDVTLSVGNYAKLKNINIHFDTNTEEFITLCDSSMIERILLNLLSNAIKFTDEYKNIYVYIIANKSYVDIFIEDEGIGMSEIEQNHVFERFVQADKSMKRKNEGSGIGLSIVKSLIDLHGGSVKVTSTLGVGSTFIVHLPRQGDYSYDLPVDDFNDCNVELELSDIYEVAKNI